MLIRLLAVLVSLLSPGQPAAAHDTLTPEQQLARKYAPVVLLKRQTAPCDDQGEPFLPAPVDVTFDDPGVFLRQDPPLHPPAPVDNRTLFDRDDQFYVDLPGDPRDAGCQYETDFKQRMGDQKPVIYAHIATETGKLGLAVQYWFFYWFNDFNNVHEGDWEMIQVLFDAADAEEALSQEPVSVAFAQHDGGERADWNDPKLDKIDGHPVVYVSRGSHASYFGPAVWLGWGQENSGLGCDNTRGPANRVDPDVRLLPNSETDDPAAPFAWNTFAGRWGERGEWFFNGPTGPAQKPRWEQPITWQEGLRQSSVSFYGGPVLGPAATEIYCDAVSTLSRGLILSKPYPWLVGAAALAVLAVVIVMLRSAWPTLRVSIPLYWRHLRVLAGIGAALAPFTIVVTAILLVLDREPDVSGRRFLPDNDPLLTGALSAVLLVQQALLLLLVGPAVIWATRELLEGRYPSIGRAFRTAWRAVPRVLVAELMALAVIVLLAITIIGLPFALERGVRWAFVSPAVILDGMSGREALRQSARATRGRWWRAALTLPVLAFTGAVLGPVIGILLIVAGRMPADLANSAGAVIFALTQPLAIVGGAVFYLRGFGQQTVPVEPKTEPPLTPRGAEIAPTVA